MNTAFTAVRFVATLGIAAVSLLAFATPANAVVVTSVRGGYAHTCALTDTGGVKCWGRNLDGQLGDGTNNDQVYPVDVTSLTSGVIAIAAGEYHTCALLGGGTVKCWGLNNNGQLGNGTTTSSNQPSDVTGLTGVTAIGAEGEHTCAIAGGTLYCWGRNDYGQLGDATITDRATPVPIDLGTGVTATAIGGGRYHTCVIVNGGAVKCWGNNDFGELGNGTINSTATPVDVTGLTGATAIGSGGWAHTCAQISGGAVKCWGYNALGTLGDGTFTDSATPVTVAGFTSTMRPQGLTSGAHYNCAVNSANKVQCWGFNADGQLGIGSNDPAGVPTDVVGLATDATAFVGGGNFVGCSVIGGVARCSGFNAYGGVGNGSTTSTNVQVRVVFSTTPDAYAFVSQLGVPISTVLTSNTITPGGFDAPLPISIDVGTYSIGCTGTFTAVAGTINPGDSVCVRHTSSNASGTRIQSTLTIGTVSAVFLSRTAITPFSFTSQTGVPTNSVRTSETITPAGFIEPLDISVTNGSYSIGCTGTFTTVAGTINPGDSVCVQHTAASTGGTPVTTTLNIGGTTGSFTSTTAAYTFNVIIEAGQVVPPNGAQGGGSGTVTVDTGGKNLIYSFSYSGLNSDPVAAHFRGPAARGANAGVKIDISGSPASGTVPYQPSDEADILNGLWYVDFDTTAFTPEVRGQLDNLGAAPRSTLTVIRTGTGSGSVIASINISPGINCGTVCGWSYPQGLGVVLVATPSGSSTFAGWANCPSPSGNQCTVTMNAASTIAANFAAPAAASSSGSAVVAGGYHSCAITTGGGLKCWGQNVSGELGDGTTSTRYSPVDVTGLSSGVVSVVASREPPFVDAGEGPGTGHTCALTTAGGVKCWGQNSNGQIGDNTISNRLTPVDVQGLTNGVVAIAAGAWHACALTTAGGVKCWGFNGYGQLGDGSTTDRHTPVDVSGLTSGVVAIAAGQSYTCAITSAGALKCWGYNGNAQLGDGSATNRLTPVDVSGLSSGVIAVTGGSIHTCALVSGGGLKCWGSNSFWQLGDSTDTSTPRLVPVDIPGLTSGVAAISAGRYHTCAVMADGTAKCWGNSGAFIGMLGTGNGAGALTVANATRVAGIANGAMTISAGIYHTCAVSASSDVTCWGDSSQGAVGDGVSSASTHFSPTRVATLANGIVAARAGQAHTCSLSSGGGMRCWGRNDDGELGDGTTTQRAAPVNVFGLSSGVVALATGSRHTCAVNSSFGAKCWGSNAQGQLGNTGGSSSTPVDVTGLTSGVASIAAGAFHSCALTADGAVKCWGANANGQLGDGSTTQRATPVNVSGLAGGVIAIAAGRSHTCAITGTGGVKCWGANADGQLGDNSTTDRATPVDVQGLTSGVIAVAAGSSHTCAITASNGIMCWGSNTNGELGNNSTQSSQVPVSTLVFVSGATALSAGTAESGGGQTCAISPSNVYCWGLNASAQLGDGGTTNRLFPYSTANDFGAAILATGGAHTCFVYSDGTIRCTGANANGQLGDNTTTQRLVPTGADLPRNVITFTAPAPAIAGVATALGASASSALAVTYDTWTPSTCSVSGSIVTGAAPVLCGVRASQAGDSTHRPAVQQLRLMTILPGFTLTVNKAGTGSGTVTSDVGAINCGAVCSTGYAPSTGVTLTATATGGSTFAGWSGGGCIGTGTCLVTMNATTIVTATFNVNALIVSPHDLNDDGKSDLLWRNTADGSVQAWLMNGTSVTGIAGLLPAGGGYTITHVADLNGDGYDDLLIRHTDGTVIAWLMNGLSVIAQGTLAPAGSGYSIVKVGDLDGDGKADILWQAPDGSIQAWLMNGLTATSIATFVGAGSGWNPSQVADFDGDGKDDIIWQHTDGSVQAWLMNGLSVKGIASLAPAGSGWSVVLTGDFNGDGKADLMWQHTNGATQTWLMNGLSVTSLASFTPAASGWTPVLAGDIDGDGKDDIFWQHTSGASQTWLMNGLSVTSLASFVSAGNWSAAQLLDLNGDGKLDILWRNTDGSVQAWLMNGLTVTGIASLAPPGTYVMIPPMP